MSIMTNIQEFCKPIVNTELTTEQRAFAVMEAICKLVSFISLGGIPVLTLLRLNNVEIPKILVDYAVPILLAAAIGYLTNWIAIEMLFRPYEKTMRHPFALLTFGYWRQGLIPKNKETIACKIATTAEQELIRPQVLAEDLCGMIVNVLEDKSVLSSIKKMMQARILEHSQDIADCLAPKIEEEILGEIKRLLTTDNVSTFWKSRLEPLLNSEKTKDRLTEIVTDFIEAHSSDLAEEIRPSVIRMIQEYCQEKGGVMFGGMLSKMADRLVAGMLSKETLAQEIKKWIKKPESFPLIREKMPLVIEACREYANSVQTDDTMGEFVNGLCLEFKKYIHTSLSSRLQPAIQQMTLSEDLWDALMNQIPKCKAEVEQLVASHGLPMIIEKLNIGGRIHDAVVQQDMPAFHTMINEISSQHLCAIQVLGFLLGGLAGTLLVFI